MSNSEGLQACPAAGHRIMNVLCLDPVDHLIEFKNSIEHVGNVEYAHNKDKNNILNILSAKKHNILIASPNNIKFMVDKNLLSNSNIRFICTVSTGVTHIDLKYCDQSNIQIISLGNESNFLRSISSTAEHAFGLMMCMVRNINSSFESVKENKWCANMFLGRQLTNLTAGVVGYGRLGRMFANYCSSFGMKVVVCDPYVHVEKFDQFELKEVFKRSNVVSLHVRLNEETMHLVDKSVLSVSNDLWLINTSRGEVVNEPDVINALKSNNLKGYATDVVQHEFHNMEDSPIISNCDKLNIIVTPHVGGSTYDAQNLTYLRILEILKSKLSD